MVGPGSDRLLPAVRRLHAADVVWREAGAALHDPALAALQLPVRAADAGVWRLAGLHVLLTGA